MNNLPENEPRAALAYIHELDNLIEANFVFLPQKSTEILNKLLDELILMPSMELACLNDHYLKSPDLYEDAIGYINSCLTQMRNDIFN